MAFADIACAWITTATCSAQHCTSTCHGSLCGHRVAWAEGRERGGANGLELCDADGRVACAGRRCEASVTREEVQLAANELAAQSCQARLYEPILPEGRRQWVGVGDRTGAMQICLDWGRPRYTTRVSNSRSFSPTPCSTCHASKNSCLLVLPGTIRQSTPTANGGRRRRPLGATVASPDLDDLLGRWLTPLRHDVRGDALALFAELDVGLQDAGRGSPNRHSIAAVIMEQFL